MPEITTHNIARAAARCRAAARKCRVSYLASREAAAEGSYAFDVFCPNGHRHVVILVRNPDGRLFSECQMPDDGEMCPSELGKHVCWHVASALPLMLAIEEGTIGRNTEAHRAGEIEIAVMLDAPLDAPMPQQPAKVFRFPRETVREFITTGGTVRDRRCGGIQY